MDKQMKTYTAWLTVGVEVATDEIRPFDDELYEELREAAREIPLGEWDLRCDLDIEIEQYD